MSKISVKKVIKYYDKDNYNRTELLHRTLYDTKTEAIDRIQNEPLHYIKNSNGLSAYEEIYTTIQKDKNNWEKYSKYIDNESCEEVIAFPKNKD